MEMGQNTAAGQPHATVIRRSLGDAAWGRLAPGIRTRFGTATATGGTIFFVGSMIEVWCSRIGQLIAHAGRAMGTPLPPYRGDNVPTFIRIYQHPSGRGTVWERIYCFPGRRPVTVASTKTLDPATGMLEYAGRGIGMMLDVFEQDAGLHFVSRRYIWQLGRLRLPLPSFLTPGTTHVTHTETRPGWFRFTMTITHPWFGETFRQDGVFRALEDFSWTSY